MKFFLSVITLLVLIVTPTRAQDRQRAWFNYSQTLLAITPDNLEAILSISNRPNFRISAPQPDLGRVTDFHTTTNTATWNYPDSAISVSVALTHDGLFINFRSEKPGNFSWPILDAEPATKAWIIPTFEGVYVPATDEKWIAFLTKQSPLNTTADLCMPFWGWNCGDATITWIATNAFNNELAFTNQNGRLAARFTHEFTRNNSVKEFGFLIRIGGASPIAPAKIYREYLGTRQERQLLCNKWQHTPEIKKLLGAAHIYLWGDDLLAADDVKDWKAFTHQLQTNRSRFYTEIKPAIRTVVTNAASAEWIDRYAKSQILEELNRLLLQRSSAQSDLSEAELCQQNSQALAAEFPDLLASRETWGDGLSPKMISRLADAGLDRLWLGAGGWEGFVRRPETVESAKSHGYLIGPYDSYHSIHSPKATNDTWATAQFDQQLYDTGGIVKADGTKRKGFKQTGFLLSPQAARPYVEKRVDSLMKQFRANSWFIDCDGFGEYFDDYSEAHPATQQSDLQARCARMAWIRDTYGAVIGSEGCSAGVAGTIDFAHGVMTPVIGWGDPDLKDKSSKYFLGSYYPPNAPAVFFKPVLTKEEYRYLYFDPRFRLPLFQTVFHDSVVATHHWSAPSGKFSDVASTVELLELLYNVPPLYHLNIEEFQKRKAAIKKHYDFFSPLHRLIAPFALTKFEWLTPDHLVHRTDFGPVELVANFQGTPYTYRTNTIPARSILARYLDGGKILVFTPAKSQ